MPFHSSERGYSASKLIMTRSLVFCFVCVLLSSLKITAQEIGYRASLGAVYPVLDNGIGYHIAVNPTFNFNKEILVEGQLSFSQTQISGAFLSGKTGRESVVGAFVGARYYLNSPEKEVRFALNYLMGLYVVAEQPGDQEFEAFLGVTPGFYIEKNKIYIGAAFESPQNAILKLGYIF